ncbi:hypothetical protein [Streptomyces sp. I8-5]|uniref:hypothetical protein n=1 Tax=Streptomyces sp. I8-5 TaxID=3104277 RepID=UPI003865315F
MHRADDQDTLDLIRAFMSMNVTLVLIGVGIPASGLLREGRLDPTSGQSVLPPSRHATVHSLEVTQTERRFDLVELDRFRYDTDQQITAWTTHLAGLESALRLLNAGRECSRRAACPSTSSFAPTASSASSNGSSRTGALKRSSTAPSA